jgi:hypothetical protein
MANAFLANLAHLIFKIFRGNMEPPDGTRLPSSFFFSSVFNLGLPWFQRFIFIIFIAKGRGKINLWLKAAIDSSSRANQFELGSDEVGSDPDSVS